MNGNKPSKQIGKASAIGIPGGVIIAWAVGLTGVDVPPEIAVAFGGLLTGALGWFIGPDA